MRSSHSRADDASSSARPRKDERQDLRHRPVSGLRPSVDLPEPNLAEEVSGGLLSLSETISAFVSDLPIDTRRKLAPRLMN